MAAVVESVPNPSFAVAPLTTTSGTIVSRRKMKIPCNYPTDYGHNRQSRLPFYVDFDIQDAESFLDLKSLRFCFTMKPSFFTSQDTPYEVGWAPKLDESVQSLIASVHIMNTQGTEFETILNYGHIACVVNKYSQSALHKTGALNEYSNSFIQRRQGPTGLVSAVPRDEFITTNNQTNDEIEIVLTLQQSMFLNRIRMLPLFLFRSALRIRIEFQDPRICFKAPIFNEIQGNMGVNNLVRKLVAKQSQANRPSVWLIAKEDGTKLKASELGLPPTDSGVIRFTFENGDQSLWFYTPNADVNVPCMPISMNKTLLPDITDDTLYNAALSKTNETNLGRIVTYEFCRLPPDWSVTVAPPTDADDVIDALRQLPKWDYVIQNCEALCEYVKPSSEVMVQYLNAFNSPSGIPYAYSSILYHQYNVPDGSLRAPLQISLPFSVRSLKGIMVLITDPLSVYAGSDSTVYYYPSISAHQMRGLREAELTIGGQRFPGYKYQFYRNLDNNKRISQEHFQELESLFNITGNVMITPNFAPQSLYRFGENFRDYGDYDGITGTLPTANHRTNFDVYRDTSSFVLAFTTQKTDGDFASGIDTTAAGSITLNLTLDPHCRARPRLIHIYGFADRVATIQKDATLVRG